MSPEPDAPSAKMDPTGLWREETFTDRKVGTIRRLSPVKADGSPDAARKTLYIGEAQILTTAGPLPISFEIRADSLEQAVAGYDATAQAAFEEAMEELQELRRRAASSLVIPPAGANVQGGGLGGLGPGGLPPGGKINLR